MKENQKKEEKLVFLASGNVEFELEGKTSSILVNTLKMINGPSILAPELESIYEGLARNALLLYKEAKIKNVAIISLSFLGRTTPAEWQTSKDKLQEKFKKINQNTTEPENK